MPRRAGAVRASSSVNRSCPTSQHVPDLVAAGLVERGLEADDHAIPPDLQRVGAHPAPVRAQDLVVRRAHQARVHPGRSARRTRVRLGSFARTGSRSPVCRSSFGPNTAAPPSSGRSSMRRAVPLAMQHRRAGGDARRTSVAHDVESQRLERRHESGVAQVLGHHLGAGRQARLHVLAAPSARARRPSWRAAPRRPSPTGSTCWCTR